MSDSQLFLRVPVDPERVEVLLARALEGSEWAEGFEWVQRGPNVAKPLLDIVRGEASATLTRDGKTHVLDGVAIQKGLDLSHAWTNGSKLRFENPSRDDGRRFLRLCLYGK